MLHALAHFFGIDNLSGPFYGFWSGVGLIGLFRAHNCHTKGGCWHLARYDVAGTPFRVCSRCHPIVPTRGPSLNHIHEAHRAHRQKGIHP